MPGDEKRERTRLAMTTDTSTSPTTEGTIPTQPERSTHASAPRAPTQVAAAGLASNGVSIMSQL